MRYPQRTIGIAILICFLTATVLTVAAWGIDLGDIIKVGGIAWLVSQYGDQIDSFITSALGEREAAVQGATKVVPILSLGGGGYIGAAQVVGNPDNVKTVKAVFQVEAKFGSARARVLLPTATDKASGNPNRAKGVGVSAVIEFKI